MRCASQRMTCMINVWQVSCSEIVAVGPSSSAAKHNLECVCSVRRLGQQWWSFGQERPTLIGACSHEVEDETDLEGQQDRINYAPLPIQTFCRIQKTSNFTSRCSNDSEVLTPISVPTPTPKPESSLSRTRKAGPPAPSFCGPRGFGRQR